MPSKQPNRVLYAALTPDKLVKRIASAPVAYLPLGTLEWHGEHLPLGADGIQAAAFFMLLAERAGGVVLPMLFVGPDRSVRIDGRDFHGMDFLGFPPGRPERLPGSAYWVGDGLFGDILLAVLKQLARAGIRVVVGHGHGPSTAAFSGLAGEVRAELGLTLLTCWRDDEGRKDEPYDDGFMIDHAAANETSILLALRPELVRMGNLPKDPAAPLKGVGGQDPRLDAGVRRGRRIVNAQLERMTELIRRTLAALPGNPQLRGGGRIGGSGRTGASPVHQE